MLILMLACGSSATDIDAACATTPMETRTVTGECEDTALPYDANNEAVTGVRTCNPETGECLSVTFEVMTNETALIGGNCGFWGAWEADLVMLYGSDTDCNTTIYTIPGMCGESLSYDVTTEAVIGVRGCDAETKQCLSAPFVVDPTKGTALIVGNCSRWDAWEMDIVTLH